MKLKTKNIRSILFKKNSYLILFIFSFMFFDSNTPLAQALSCKGPADVVLAIDRSANMAGGSKFDTVKNSSVNFIDKLFDPDRKPNSSFIPYDYHQIGLSIFNNNITSENLSTDDSYIKDIISNLGAPDSSCKAGLAVQKAQANLNANGNSKATKTIIILISGPPDDLAFAIEQVRIAQESGTRIISVGINLDELTGQQRIDAENFISNEHIFSYDCYYASDNPSATLDGCTPILYDNLNDSLNKVYDDITGAVCDEFAPVLSISRQPGGTLYDIDKLTITSIANDDVGFKSHSIVWSDNWPDDQIEKNDCSLIGKIISCDTEELEPFAIGETINFGSSVTDANDNIVTIDPLGNIAKVAAVSLDFEALFRNKNNEINVQISDYTGPDEFFIRVDNGGLTRVINEEDESSKMTCSGAGSVRDCVFYFNPSCASEGVYTDPGNAVDIYIDVESIGITRSEYISSKLDEPLGLLSEGAAWGNCSDGIDNDCDGIVDSGEMLCDVGGPSVGILRNPSGDIYDFEEDEVTPMPITFESTAGDSNGIKQHAIYHRENGGDWQIFDCNDADPGDGKIICDGIEISQNIATVSTTIDSFTAGTLVEYYSVAVDYSGNDNSTNSATESFIVRNRSCFGIDNLEDCRGMPGKCCGEVCNAVISNPKNYNTNCAQEICGDALKYEEDVRVVREDGRAISFDGINDYVNIPSVNPTEAITVSAWVKSATDTGYSGYWQIVSKYSAYLLGTSWSGGKQMCFIIYSGGWNYGSCYTVPDPYPQEWHHFAGTYDKQTGEKKLYVDGILRDTTNFVGSINPDEGPMHIGHREGSASDYFNGFVDEIYIYGRALDLGEIENLRDGISVSSADLAGYWSFDEEFGDVVYDYSGNGNPGTLMNFPIPVVEPGILWQWTVDGGKNGASCDIKSDSDGCYALMTNGGCEERLYSCSAGYCNYNSDKDKDHCEGEILYNFGCSGSFCELNPNPPVEDPVCDVTFGSLFLDAYDSDYESEGESAFISGSHGTETGEVLDNMTNTVLLKSIANDTSGISEQIIYWKKEGDADFTVKDDCVVPCGGGVDCICEESIIGPFDIGDVIKFYATSKDNSPNKTGETTITYSFTVFDNQCYDIDNNENKSDLTSCEAGTGKCCGGICDTSVEDPFSYHDDCRKDSCSLTSWVYGQDNGGGSCGSTDSCLDHYSLNNGFYSGCITGGNKCSFGYCDTSLSLISAPSCDGNLLTNYSCDPDNETGTCQPKDSDIDCSSAGVYDGDTVACNCDCDNYDIEEKVYSSLSFDGVDDHVEIPDDSSLNISDEISVEVWVKDVVGTGSSQDDGAISDNDFVSKIRATIGTGENDGDYDKLSTWEAAIESDLTAATSQIFTVSDRGTYDYLTDDGQAVTFSGGGTGILKHLNTYNKTYIISVAGAVNTGVVTVDSTGHTFNISDTGQQIGRAIAECYNDWSEGLDDSTGISGWITDSNHYIKVYTPLSERHNGTVKESGDYTGFALIGNGTKIGISIKYTEIDGIILDSITVDGTNTYSYGVATSYSNGDFSKISNCIFRNFGVPDYAFPGMTIGDYKYAHIYNNIFIKSRLRIARGYEYNNVYVYNNTFYNSHLKADNTSNNRTIVKNNLVYHSGVCYEGGYGASSSNNISIDATAPGANSLINKTLEEIAFVDISAGAEDLHIQLSSHARNAGVNLSSNISSDIDSSNYLSSWDIGADEYLEGIIVSKGTGENAYSLIVGGDGNIYGNINDQSVSAQIADNNWHQVVMTYNGNSQKLYLDGNEVDSKTLIGAININTEDLIIGKGSAGMIDEVIIYNRALYPEEVKDHYDGIFVDNTDLIGHWNFDKGTGTTADDTSSNNNDGTLKNDPEWMKYGVGDDKDEDENVIDVLNRNVPENWQVCTDGKDNDCDGVTNEYEAGNSQCDGKVDGISLNASSIITSAGGATATAYLAGDVIGLIDITNPGSGYISAPDVSITGGGGSGAIATVGISSGMVVLPVDITNAGSGYTSAPAVALTGGNLLKFLTPVDNNIKDTYVSQSSNDFTLSATSTDDFGIDQILIEWTTDNWATIPPDNFSCNGVGTCEVCVAGGSCSNDDISLSSLSAETVFVYRACAWDNNNNKICTDDYSFNVLDSNTTPYLDNLEVIVPDFCEDGLEYILSWKFNDDDILDKQSYYEVQMKEGDNDWTAGPFVVDLAKDVIAENHSFSYHPIVNGENLEYGEKKYYWRVRAKDDREGGYAKISEWVEYDDSYDDPDIPGDQSDSDGDGDYETFTTPAYKFPQVEFFANLDIDSTINCLPEGCNVGEDIVFHDDTTFFVQCNNVDNKQCLSVNAARCDVDSGQCLACENNGECNKFDSSIDYSCNVGNGICEISPGSCVDADVDNNDDDNCLTVDNSKCDVDSGQCVACDDDSQCAKFTIKDEDNNDIGYICNAGKCEFPGHRTWDFYGYGVTGSTYPNPINNYVESVFINYDVTLKITDISGKYCSKSKNIQLGGELYPKWNEVSSSN